MTAFEAHIGVLTNIQKVNGYQENMFSPEEIDFQISRQQNRLVEEIIAETFEDHEVARGYLLPLHVKNYKLTTYVPNANEVLYEQLAVYGVLPGNYFSLINNRSKVYKSDDPLYCADISALRVDTLYQNFGERVGAIAIATPLGTVAPFYFKAQVILTIGGTPTSVLTVPEELVIKSKKSVFYLVNYIQDYFTENYPDVQVYWERFRNKTYPGKLIFVTLNTNITAVTISFLRNDSSPDTSSTVTLTETVYRRYVPITASNFPGFQISTPDNLDQESDKLYEQNINPFFRSKPSNPKTILSGNLLFAYESETFIISELVIDYVRKPKNVSINLSQGLELSGNGPQIVVDRTVEFLKMVIENPQYQAVLQDNKLRNQV